MTISRRPAILVLALLVACSKESMQVEPGISLRLANQRAATISDVRYRLGFVIPERVDGAIDAEATIRFKLADTTTPVVLDFRENGGKIGYITVNGRITDYEFRDEHIIIHGSHFLPGENAIGVEFIAGDASLNRNPGYLYTLFVPDRARTAFPLFDQPNLKAVFELTLDLPFGWTAMSNAPVSRTHYENGRAEYRFQESDRIPSYLFSFVAGRFQTLSRDVDGRRMTMLHRETDEEKVARNVDDIFDLHAAALDWLEDYTGIEYPYRKFGFALIPSFQYGGMEHVGAIQYRASSLLLDEAPSETELLGRAGLIAHETAHMWFGNLVTMEWFNDVWTKEVFANFMAAKIVNPGFPDVDHDLNFLLRHYPGAYSVDRSAGANPIRQHLPNLNEAGQMYGAIIYDKAPIMMRQLELLIGEERFREGMQEYLSKFAFSNATWPALIGILDRKTDEDLVAWSEVWVNSPGRPEHVIVERGGGELTRGTNYLEQRDPAGTGRTWRQQFELATRSNKERRRIPLTIDETGIDMDALGLESQALRVFAADGNGYGLFPLADQAQYRWGEMRDIEKGAVLVNHYEHMLEGNEPDPVSYWQILADFVQTERNQLLLDIALEQLETVNQTILSPRIRQRMRVVANNDPISIGDMLWDTMQAHGEPSYRKMFFERFASLANTQRNLQRAYDVWHGDLEVGNLPLSEDDLIDLAGELAIRLPDRADDIIAFQLERTENPDNVRKLDFVAPSLSPDIAVRDAFFASLADAANRANEPWVLEALSNLHHPLRTPDSVKYIRPSLERLEEIQVTGDIFFPKRWLDATLENHRSDRAVAVVQRFLEERPDYNEQLRMKILQSADMMFRANALVAGTNAEQNR